MSDDRHQIEQLLDLVLFAPLGVVLELRQRVPDLAANGRRHAEQRVQLARFVGKFAVTMGRQQLERQVRELLGRPSSPAVAPARSPSPRAVPPAPSEPIEAAVVEDVPDVDDLPVAGYDTLAASQIVARLGDLSPEERRLVRRYEEATRRRRTVLGRIAQLEGAP